MHYAVAVGCIFRYSMPFREGKNWAKIFSFFRENNITRIETESYGRFFVSDAVYADYLNFLAKEEAKGLEVSLHRGGGDLSAPLEAARKTAVSAVLKELERNLRFINPSLLVLHPGAVCLDEADEARRYRHLAESLKPILEKCAKHRIKLCVENMRWQYPVKGEMELEALLGKTGVERCLREEPDKAFIRVGSDLKRLEEFVMSFKSDHIGICLDTGHAHISEGKKFSEKMKKYGAKICHVHASDNFGRNDDHLPPSKAAIDWDAFFAALRAMNYTGWYELEIVLKEAQNASDEHILKVISEGQEFAASNLTYS